MDSPDEGVIPIPETEVPSPAVPPQDNPENADAAPIAADAAAPDEKDASPPKQKTLEELRAEVQGGLDRVDVLQQAIRERSAEFNALLTPFQKQIQNLKQKTDLSNKARVAAREKARKEFSTVAAEINTITAAARYECELREELGQAINRRHLSATSSAERIMTWQVTIENGASAARELIENIQTALVADEKRWID